MMAKIILIFSDDQIRFKIPKPDSKTPRDTLVEMKFQKTTQSVTISKRLSNGRKNEIPVSHVTKMTPNGSMKKFNHLKKRVVPRKFHFSESPK
jgi:hypothetical protein